MGVLKSMREVQRQSREIQRHADPSAMLGGALERMKATGESMAAMTQAAQVASTGVEAQATIAAVSQTGTMVNFQPTVKVDLTVMPEGALPYPASVTQVVPQVYLGKAQPGKPVAVKVDRSDRSLVWIDWAAA